MGVNESHDIYGLVYFTAIGKSKPSQDAEGCVTTAALMRCRGILLDYYKLAFVTTLRGRLTEDGSLHSYGYFYFLFLAVAVYRIVGDGERHGAGAEMFRPPRLSISMVFVSSPSFRDEKLFTSNVTPPISALVFNSNPSSIDSQLCPLLSHPCSHNHELVCIFPQVSLDQESAVRNHHNPAYCL